MALQFEGRLATGQAALDGDLRALHLASGTDGMVLYAATGRHGGLSSYALAPEATPQVMDTAYFGTLPAELADTRLDRLTVDGQDALVVGTDSGGQLLYYMLEPDAGLGASGALSTQAAGTAAWDASGTQLITLDDDAGTLGAYETGGSGLDPIAVSPGSEWQLSEGTLVTALPVGAETVVVAAAGGTASDLVSFRVSAAEGTLAGADRSGAADGLGFSVPTAMESVTAHGSGWVILAAAGSGTLSVLKVGGDGQLTPTDHLLDTGETRFGGVQALSTVVVGEHVLVFAGGGDDGLAVFSLLPNGRLLHLQSIAEAQGRGLGDVVAIEAGVVGNEVQVFVASESLPGLSQFSWDIETLGAVRKSKAAQLQGTGGDDVLLAEGPATITGGAGDDILVAGSGETVLEGGAGADIFVLVPNDATQRITDFQPGLDHLDLSHFPLLRSPAQLQVTPLPDGVQLEFQTARIIITSASGLPLELSDLWPTGRFSAPDRLLTEAIPFPDRVAGSDGADHLVGGTGRDTIYAAPGDDVIWGSAGADLLDGGWGHDEIWGGSGDDTVTGDWGNDTIGTGEGADSIAAGGGHDLVWAGAGDDTISGDGGHDTIWASGGADLVWGGDGKDWLDGADGRDRLFAGAGNDTLNGGADADHLDGGWGDDVIWGGRGGDTILGDWGHDTIGAGDGADRIEGGGGRDLAWGGGGDDTLAGGGGHDTLWAHNGADVIWAGDGNDLLGGGLGHDEIWGASGSDTIYGGGGDDTLAGGEGDDEIWASDGNDTLRGGTGADTLIGGRQDDELTGMAGADIFVFGKGHGRDRITDFVPGQDRIEIGSGIGFPDLAIRQIDGGTEIASGSGTILLDGVAPDQISAADFLFT